MTSDELLKSIQAQIDAHSMAALAASHASDVYSALTTARAEPAQGAPAASLSHLEKMDHLYKAWRNKKTNDGSTTKLYNDAGNTVDTKQTTSADAGVVTKEEWVTGP